MITQLFISKYDKVEFSFITVDGLLRINKYPGGMGDAGFVLKSGKRGCVSHVY